MSKTRFKSLPRSVASLLVSLSACVWVGLFFYFENEREIDTPEDIAKTENDINYYLSEIEKFRFFIKNRESTPEESNRFGGIPLEKDESWPDFSIPNWNGENSWSDFSRRFHYLNDWNEKKALSIVLDEYKKSPLRYDYQNLWEDRKKHKNSDWITKTKASLMFEVFGVALLGLGSFPISYVLLYLINWVWYFTLE